MKSLLRPLSLAAAALCSISTPALADNLGLLVPAYIYPSWWEASNGWAALNQAASQVSVTAIANPNSGPGSTADSNWADRLNDYNKALGQFHSAGGTAIGYVSTAYGARNLDAIKADILSYKTNYQVQGIFFDEMSSDAGKLGFYQTLSSYASSLGLTTQVGNVGTTPAAGFNSLGMTLVAYENFGSQWANAPTPTAGDNFAALAHTTDQAGMASIVASAAAKGYHYVYVTDGVYVDQNSNPWGTLPSYWQAEVAAVKAVSAVPEPDMAWLLMAGLPLLAWRARRTKTATRA